MHLIKKKNHFYYELQLMFGMTNITSYLIHVICYSSLIVCVCRRQRMAEMKQAQLKARFGEVREISKVDYVTEVNKAGEGVWVVLHVYKQA